MNDPAVHIKTYSHLEYEMHCGARVLDNGRFTPDKRFVDPAGRSIDGTSPRAMQVPSPGAMLVGLAESLGWTKPADDSHRVYNLNPTTLGAMVKDMEMRLKFRALRVGFVHVPDHRMRWLLQHNYGVRDRDG